MFMKFLLTVAVVALIWFGFRFSQRLAMQRQAPREPADQAAKPKPRFTPDADGESVRDLVKCPICNTWRAPNLGTCGRKECPH